MEKIVLRNASRLDIGIVAGVFTRARATLTFLPELHTQEEDRVFVREVLFKTCRIRLAFLDKRACGFIAVENGWIRQMHVDPGHFGKGVGTALIRDAQSCNHQLELWCFQNNKRARQLYERFGFAGVEFTDGAGNEEKTPDVRYVWQRG
ncbi:MAG: GNAT family N-acetyltransferase [Alphaproteobacteria bacterium]|nr:GNAT family N-acetyltransferase [Alphaproteobacteria bacterium]